jgi:hypothetical protein
MGWRGAGGGGAASLPTFLFMGGVLQMIGGTLEFFLGNTFPFVVFSTFGGFWLPTAQLCSRSTAPPRHMLRLAVPSHLNLLQVLVCSHIPSWDGEISTSDNSSSILPSLHGTSLLHIPHLLDPHKYRPRVCVRLPCTWLRYPCRGVLADWARKSGSGW